MEIALQEAEESDGLALIMPRDTDSTDALQKKKDLLNSMNNDAGSRLKRKRSRRQRRPAKAKEEAEADSEPDKMLKDLK